MSFLVARKSARQLNWITEMVPPLPPPGTSMGPMKEPASASEAGGAEGAAS
jgi:hypothetical protein